ncbi:MAG: putative ABC transporter permease [Ruminococcus sp.]
MKKKIQEYFFYFMLYSIIGWIYEVFLEVAVYRWGFSNRGVLFGPYCIIYGTGALILIFALGRLQKKRIYVGKILVTPVLVFVGIVIITTVVELIGSYIMEFATGGWLWDYRRFSFNFQGRIALNPSIRFGIGGMIFLYLLQPLFVRLTRKMPDKVFDAVTGIMAVLFVLDIVVLAIRGLG